MKIQTFSVLVGTNACNAKCPFCVSKMTPNGSMQRSKANLRNFDKAMQLASRCGATTAMITGKGEPTLWMDDVFGTISDLSDFPLIELQTNGLILSKMPIGKVRDLYATGLTTVAVSVVHWDRGRNAEIYGGKHFDIPSLVEKLHKAGLSVRLSVVMVKGWIDDPTSVEAMIDYAKYQRVEQLTFMRVNAPGNVNYRVDAKRAAVNEWVDEHRVDVLPIRAWLLNNGDKISTLAHGAEVFDVGGQNVCLGSCLGKDSGDELRNLIYHPDGHIRTDWAHEGSVIL